MGEFGRLVVVVVVAALVIAWLGVGSHGQPFHEPGQSDRSVIFEG